MGPTRRDSYVCFRFSAEVNELSMGKESQQWWCDTEHLKSELRNRSTRGGKLILFGQIARAIIEFGSSLVLVRLLLPEHFGLVAMVAMVTGFLVMFRDLGLATVTVQREDLTLPQLNQLFWASIAISSTAGLLIMLLSPAIASYYSEPILLIFTLIFGLSFMIDGLCIQHAALLQRKMLFDRAVAIALIGTAASFGSAIIMALWGWGVWALVLRTPLRAVVSVICHWTVCNWRPGLPAWPRGISDMISFGGNLTIYRMLTYLSINLDDVLIGRYFGPIQLGFYQKSYELFMAPLQQVNNPISAVSIPTLSRLVDDPERYRRVYLQILKYILLVTMPAGVILISSAESIVVTVFGETWREASNTFYWLGWLTFTHPTCNTVSWIYTTQGKVKQMVRWGLYYTLLSVGSFIIGLKGGAVGVAMSFSIVHITIITPMSFWMVERSGPIRMLEIYKAMLPLLACGFVSLGSIEFIKINLLPELHQLLDIALTVILSPLLMAACLGTFASGRELIFKAFKLILSRTNK